MKKIIVIGILSMFLLASLTAVSAVEMKAAGTIGSSGNGYNFWIEEVTYEPDPGNGDITIFTVSVGAEGVPEGGTFHPHVESRVNGQLQDMNVVTFEEDGVQTCQVNGYDIDFSEDLVEIEVDPENTYNEETNEDDNLWTLTTEELKVLVYYNQQKVKDATVKATDSTGIEISIPWDGAVGAYRAELPAFDDKVTNYAVTVSAEGYKVPDSQTVPMVLGDPKEMLFSLEKKSINYGSQQLSNPLFFQILQRLMNIR